MRGTTVKKHKKHWFFNAGLAVLVCVICIWAVKLVTVDIGSTKAAVFKQAKIPATRKQMTPQRIFEDKYNMQGPSTGSLVFRHTPSTMPISAIRKERRFPNKMLDLIRMWAEQEDLILVINRQDSYEGVEKIGK
jgi:hypothetical protein